MHKIHELNWLRFKTTNNMLIAVDFDGTIVEHKYPEIGEPLPGAFETLIALAEAGHKLILWTYRDGQELQDAVDYCLDKGLMFYAVNQSYPDEEYSPYISRKIQAELFIDDRNFGGFPGWDIIGQKLLSGNLLNDNNSESRKKRRFKLF